MLPIIAIIAANVIWGAAPPIFKFALTDIPPFTLAFIRFFVAGLLFLPFMFKKTQKFTVKDFLNIILGGIWGISITVAFFFLGLKLAPSINVHIISALGPVVLYALSLVVLKEKPHPKIMKGMLISLAGVAVVVFAPILKAEITHTSSYAVSNQLLGNAFFVLSMLGSVLIVVYNKKVSPNVNTFTMTGIQFFVGAISFFPFMIPELKTWSFSSLTLSGWVGIVYGIFFSSALAYLAMNYALKKVSAQELAVYGNIMPIIAVVIAVPLLKEYPDIFFILGSVLVLFGMYISQQHPHYKKLHKKIHER